MNLAWVTSLLPRRINSTAYCNMQKDQMMDAVAKLSPSRSPGNQRRLSVSPTRDGNKRQRMDSSVKIAVIGCIHGELDSVYSAIEELERAKSIKIDAVICPGDFQAVRNQNDLRCMACPDKYKDMRSFWKYYAGILKAKVPTIFVGGNHEASNHLQEMPLGGLVAPNIYYMGNAGVINFRGLRIAGISGVYVEHAYNKERTERPPYNGSAIRSVYRTRREDVERLMRVKRPVDIFVSHDWPRGITDFGNLGMLLKAKPFLASEISDKTLGNPGSTQLLQKLQPEYWFAAHMHVKFPALVTHSDSGKQTKFLALDKVLPRRDCIQVLDVLVRGGNNDEGNAMSLCGAAAHTPTVEACINLDAEWLSILRTEQKSPEQSGAVTDGDIAMTLSLLKDKDVRTNVMLESDFERRAPTYEEERKSPRVPYTFSLQPKNVELFSALELSIPPVYRSSQSPSEENNFIDKDLINIDTNSTS